MRDDLFQPLLPVTILNPAARHAQRDSKTHQLGGVAAQARVRAVRGRFIDDVLN
jgi:hypothetical protein